MARKPLATSAEPLLLPTSLEPKVRELLDSLLQRFGQKRLDMLAGRQKRRDVLRGGDVARLEETVHIRRAEWTIDPLPAALLERRVELLGSTRRRDLIAGMNSGAKSYVADLENSPVDDLDATLKAHGHLRRAAQLKLTYIDESGTRFRVNPNTTTRLMLAPRPMVAEVPTLHGPIPAAFLDLVLFSLNTRELLHHQGGVCLYLRGVHDHQEARLWNDLFDAVEEHLHLERGSFRATVMIDTVNAALETDEILFELLHHSAGLSLDPQAYAADHITLFSAPDRAVMPDRESIGLNAHMLRSLSLHVIGTCHRRGAHAMGAPAYVLPPNDAVRSNLLYAEMLMDKEREAVDGHDGTLVGHPGLVNAAMTEFNKNMPKAHQFHYQRRDRIEPSDLVQRPEGAITVESLVDMIRTALRAIAGNRNVDQGGRLHDRSSVRLAVALLWQWSQSEHGMITASGLDVHDDLVKYLVRKEARRLFGHDRSGVVASDRLCTLVFASEPPLDPLA